MRRWVTKDDQGGKEGKPPQAEPHLAVQLPEIVSQIIWFLAPYDESDQTSLAPQQHMLNRQDRSELYASLFVSRLWFVCTVHHLWRHVVFEDTQINGRTFHQFSQSIRESSADSAADGLGHHLSPSLSSTILPSLSVASYHPPATHINQKGMLSSSALSPDTCPVGATESQGPPRQVVSFSTPTHQTSLVKKKKRRGSAASKPLHPPRFSTALYRRSLRSLTLKRVKDKAINTDLEAMAKDCTRLQRLEVYICDHIDNQTLMPYFHTHCQLTYISLAGCSLISDEAVVAMAHHVPGLVHLDLRACGQVSDVGLVAVANHCSRLKHLNVGRIREKERITNLSILQIAQHTQVSVLGLAGCHIDDQAMVQIAKHRGSALERVSVNNCRKLTNQSIYALIRHCPKLTVFEMKDCHRINDWYVVEIMLNRHVLLSLSERQHKECHDWAERLGKIMKVVAPMK
ncbi:RNI-like protein [Hesseltinella vesiculosa]|uniref:RNI-like protein n=1 Tax=Hesseltinella vesiculosa TaxID=101127 RepID=A0A1X2G7F0_9FUNG|nr:RNI-like protein [Hesseltinella vesiculosa]